MSTWRAKGSSGTSSRPPPSGVIQKTYLSDGADPGMDPWYEDESLGGLCGDSSGYPRGMCDGGGGGPPLAPGGAGPPRNGERMESSSRSTSLFELIASSDVDLMSCARRKSSLQQWRKIRHLQNLTRRRR